jgi:hypothetical protein
MPTRRSRCELWVGYGDARCRLSQCNPCAESILTWGNVETPAVFVSMMHRRCGSAVVSTYNPKGRAGGTAMEESWYQLHKEADLRPRPSIPG